MIAGFEIRPATEADLEVADHTRRLAFGTWTHHLDPPRYGGDAACLPARFHANPAGALVATVDGTVVGSNFSTIWGSFGVVGPLSIHPNHWGKGIGKALVAAGMPQLAARGCRQVGLLTFAESPKHIGLYQRFGFWPQHLTAVLSRPVEPVAAPYRIDLRDFAGVTNSIFEGLDLSSEIRCIDELGLGQVLSLEDGSGFAACHVGPGSEAHAGELYVKFAAVRPGPGAEARFDRLVDGCIACASDHGAKRIVVGINTAREPALRRLLAHDFDVRLYGIAMQSPNLAGWNTADAWVLDDWR